MCNFCVIFLQSLINSIKTVGYCTDLSPWLPAQYTVSFPLARSDRLNQRVRNRNFNEKNAGFNAVLNAVLDAVLDAVLNFQQAVLALNLSQEIYFIIRG